MLLNRGIIYIVTLLIFSYYHDIKNQEKRGDMSLKKVVPGLFVAMVVIALLISNIGSAVAIVPGSNQRVSYRYNGAQMNQHSSQPLISGDGKKIAYQSTSTTLLLDGKGSVVRDISTGASVRINASTAGVVTDPTYTDLLQYISYTGRYVLFQSTATNLIDGETMSPANKYRLYLRDVVGGTTTLVNRNIVTGDLDNNVGSELTSLGVSSDGRFVAFTSNSTNLVSGVTDGNPHLYMLDRQANTLDVIDRNTSGQLGTSNSSWGPSGGMSCDGSIIAFQYPTNLIVGAPNALHTDVYVLDRRAGTQNLTNLTVGATTSSLAPTVSCNGDYIGFKSKDVGLDSTTTVTGSGYFRPYIYDRVNGMFHFVAVDSSGASVNGPICTTYSDPCVWVSDKGQGVFVSNMASLPGATAGDNQIYIRDIEATGVALVSKNISGISANGASSGARITADGRTVSYMSNATNLIDNDTNGYADIFISKVEY